MLCLIFMLFSGCGSEKTPQEIEADNAKKMTQSIQKTAKLNEQQSKAAADVLKKCGVDVIENIKSDSSLDNLRDKGEKGYRLTVNDSVRNFIVYIVPSGEIDNIRWSNKDFYKEGKVLLNIKDCTMTLTEKSELQYSCQETIKQVLKSPKSAEFPSIAEWRFDKTPEQIVVQSYVDAQNSFGANLRAKFKFVLDTKTRKIKSFTFDGKKVI